MGRSPDLDRIPPEQPPSRGGGGSFAGTEMKLEEAILLPFQALCKSLYLVLWSKPDPSHCFPCHNPLNMELLAPELANILGLRPGTGGAAGTICLGFYGS